MTIKNMSWESSLAAQKANAILGCFIKSTVSKSWEVVLLATWHLCAVVLGSPYKKDINVLEGGQRKSPTCVGS